MYVPGHILHVGCGSVGLIFPCPISGAAKNKATATTNKKFFIRTSFFGLHIIALMGIFPKIRTSAIVGHKNWRHLMRVWAKLLMLSVCLLLVSTVMYAQAGAALTGVVTDTSGAVLPGVMVEA